MAKYTPKPKRHKIGLDKWKVVHRYREFPGRGAKGFERGMAGAVAHDHKVMYLRQVCPRRTEWDRAGVLIHECLHAMDRKISEEWVSAIAKDITNLLGYYFEIRDRITR